MFGYRNQELGLQLPRIRKPEDAVRQLSYLVPADTRQVLSRSLTAGKLPPSANMRLVMQRYIPQQVIDADSHSETNDRGRQESDTFLSIWALRLLEAQYDARQSLADMVQARLDRWIALTASAKQFEAVSVSRLVVGLGADSVLENTLTLDRITGLPIIPGSALKGLCRTVALYELAAQLGIQPLQGEDRIHYVQALQGSPNQPPVAPLNLLDQVLSESFDKDNKRLDDLLKTLATVGGIRLQRGDLQTIAANFHPVFGNLDQAGQVVFYDAVVSGIPERGLLFDLDVMTPHFQSYYSSKGDKAPNDSDSPNPIQFFTVAEGTRFGFALGMRRGLSQNETVVNEAVQWLQTGLEDYGIGSKTNTGYGFFQI